MKHSYRSVNYGRKQEKVEDCLLELKGIEEIESLLITFMYSRIKSYMKGNQMFVEVWWTKVTFSSAICKIGQRRGYGKISRLWQLVQAQ